MMDWEVKDGINISSKVGFDQGLTASTGSKLGRRRKIYLGSCFKEFIAGRVWKWERCIGGVEEE